jgi:hypothetical protein
MALDLAQEALRTILSNTQNASSCCTTNALPRQCKEQLVSSVEGNALFTRTERTHCVGQTDVHGEVRVASRSQEIVSVASQGDRFKCISCVPRLKRDCISCIPGCQPQHAQLRTAVSKELYQLHRKICVYKMSNNWKVLTVLLYFTSYTIVWTHTELLNDIDNTVFISCYCLMFKPY